MKTLFAALAATLAMGEAASAQPPRGPSPRVAPEDMRSITPALAGYTDDVLFGEVWRRPGLAPRDRSLATISALIAGGKTAQLTSHLNRALDNGVKPSEISAIISHLAFYSGWPNSVSALGMAKDVFAQRNIAPATLLPPSSEPLPLPASDGVRAAHMNRDVAPTVPALAEYTNGVLFNDLWRRTDLAPRDRSLATITALITGGD